MEIRLLSKNEFCTFRTSFCELYRQCFNDYIDESIITHRFLENPYDEFFMCVAIDNGHIVANYTVSPTRIIRKGILLKAALSLNTMTHPHYMGKGLFVTLASRLYDYLAMDDFSIVLGFPNYISNRTFVSKLGWRDIYEIPTLELNIKDVLNGKPIESTVKEVNSFDFFNDVVNTEGEFKVYKDKAFLNWRYLHIPKKCYRIVMTDNGSWAVFKFYQNIINVVELHADKTEDIKDIVNFLLKIGIENGYEKISVWSKINTSKHLCLEKLGFRNKYPITYLAAKVLNPSCCDGIWEFQNWDVNMGDDFVY